MDVNQAFEQQLLHNLHETQAHLQRLLQCLSQEQTALRQRNIAALETSIPEKAELVSQIEAMHTTRVNLLKQMGIENTHLSLSDYITTHAPRPNKNKLEERWLAVKTLITEVKDKNLVNGAVINVSQHNNERLLNALMGGPANQSSYNSDGKFER